MELNKLVLIFVDVDFHLVESKIINNILFAKSLKVLSLVKISIITFTNNIKLNLWKYIVQLK